LLLGRPLAELRLVTCHLGGGCSVTAVVGGRSVDTTMGMTPLDGLVMATRSGSVDPGLLLHLLRRGTPANELDDILERRSGLLGLSGVSGDLREVMAARDGGHADAKLAIDVFVHRLSAAIGSMIAALDGLDAVVFTGGIGEHDPEIRSRAVTPFRWLGLTVDARANEAAAPGVDSRISPAQDAVAALVIASREEIPIARAARRALVA
jgi:acetate kinase